MQPKFYGAAAEYNKPRGGSFNTRIAAIAGLALGAIVFITVVFMIIGAINSAPRTNLQTLIEREAQLVTFVTGAQKNIQSTDLLYVNSTATLLVMSDVNSLNIQLKNVYGTTEIPDTVVKAETDTTSASTLQNAQVLGNYDHAYSQLLRDKLAAVQSLATQTMGGTSGTYKATLQTVIKNAGAIDQQVAKLAL